MDFTRALVTGLAGLRTHLLLVVLRSVIANGIWQVLPFAYLTWGRPHAPEDPDTLRFVLLLHLIGLAGALIYFTTASAAHLFLRRRRWPAIAVADGILGSVMAVALAYAGIHARPGGATAPSTPPAVRARQGSVPGARHSVTARHHRHA